MPSSLILDWVITLYFPPSICVSDFPWCRSSYLYQSSIYVYQQQPSTMLCYLRKVFLIVDVVYKCIDIPSCTKDRRFLDYPMHPTTIWGCFPLGLAYLLPCIMNATFPVPPYEARFYFIRLRTINCKWQQDTVLKWNVYPNLRFPLLLSLCSGYP